SSILTINIKIELIFFLRKNYCPTLFFVFIYFGHSIGLVNLSVRLNNRFFLLDAISLVFQKITFNKRNSLGGN
ncbi:hypothetical protein, partial [Enterococcus hirae]|uniref:hypothetical protein n=1 Tax=Enterococcus hirae TaxID=1354 RepID=UPI00355B42BE